MKYKILTFEQANNLLKDDAVEEVRIIDYNQCTVYKVFKEKLLVRPLHPYANSLLVQDERTLLGMEESNIFPDGGELKTIYSQSRNSFEKRDFKEIKDSLISNLINYLNDTNSFREDDINNLDFVYTLLKKNKALVSHGLAFVLLIGEDLIKLNTERKIRWGLVQTKTRLNPERRLVLVTSESEYFDLESRVFGKHGYAGYNYIKFSLPQFSVNLQPPIITIYKILD